MLEAKQERVKRRKNEMGKRYKPLRYAKPWKREKDEDLEQKILQDLAPLKEELFKRQQEREAEKKK
jgi:hypothetical protein